MSCSLKICTLITFLTTIYVLSSKFLLDHTLHTSNKKIGIPNLSCGNFASVVNIIENVGGSATLVSNPSDLYNFDKVILAGVGAFDYGMSCLRTKGWDTVLSRLAIEQKRPILGICLGMQLMCEDSEEGSLPGLGWISGHVQRFKIPADSKIKIPHMGWNTVRVSKPNSIIPVDNGEQRFYFVHSYHAVCDDPSVVLATTHHGSDVTAAFSLDNIFGVQFHPEKSHRFGISLMRRYVEMQC